MLSTKRLFFLFITLNLSQSIQSQTLLPEQFLDLRSETEFGVPIYKWSFKAGDSPNAEDPSVERTFLDEEKGLLEAIPFAYAMPNLEAKFRTGWLSGFQIQVPWDKVRDGDGEFYFPNFEEYKQKFRGYGWYRTEILISEDDLLHRFKSQNLTLRLGQIGQADAVYWNGRYLGGSGLFWDTPKDSLLDEKDLFPDKIRFYDIPQAWIKTDRPNILAVRVYAKYPLSPGLSHDRFYLSSKKYSERAEIWNDFKKNTIIVLSLLLGLFYLYWQFLFRKEEGASLFFALASFAIACNTFFYSQTIYSILNHGLIIQKGETISWIFLSHFLGSFFVSFSKLQKKYLSRIQVLVHSLGFSLAIGILLSPSLLFVIKLFTIWVYLSSFVTVAIIYVFIAGRKIPSMGSLSIGFGFFILCLTNDFLVDQHLDWYPNHSFLKDYGFIALSISVAVSIVSNMVGSQKLVAKQKEEKERLSRYFSPAVMETIVADKIRLGGEEREIVTLFSDIVGFTSFSEKNPPTVVLKHLNTIFEELSEIIFHYSATLDKFIGDAIMAFWGAPQKTDIDAYNAIACAVKMQKTMVRINASLGLPANTFQLRIGVNFGNAIVGNIGSTKRMDYTVIGDAVNIAARLESHGEPGRVAVSEAAFLQAGGSKCISFDETKELMLKGKSEPVKVYFVTEVIPKD